MGEFIKHIPCEKCKSKDNMAEYTDGYYCFGCGEKSTKENHTYFKNSNKLDKRPIIPPQTKDDAYPASFKKRFEREVLGERLYTYKFENGLKKYWHTADTLNLKTRQDSTVMLTIIKKENI